MFFHYRLFFKALRLGLFARPVKVRRIACVLFFTALFSVVWLLVIAGRALDHLFFPAFKKQAVEAPLFIVAPPRSGTTFMQKLIAADDAQFCCVRLLDTILPAVTFHKIRTLFSWLDARCGGPAARFSARLERRLFRGWEAMHPMRLNEPEEDNGFFVHAFVTEAVYLLFPYIDELREAGYPDAMPHTSRRKLMRYYRSCLQRHLFAVGNGRRLVSKATQHCGALAALLEEFPDCRLLTIVRNPVQCIPSHVSVFYAAWKAIDPSLPPDAPASQAYAALAVDWILNLFAHRDSLPPEQYAAVLYTDLTADPAETIRAVYRHFGWKISAEFGGHLREKSVSQRSFRSFHQYTPAVFGLDESHLGERLATILQYYGLSENTSGGECTPPRGIIRPTATFGSP